MNPNSENQADSLSPSLCSTGLAASQERGARRRPPRSRAPLNRAALQAAPAFCAALATARDPRGATRLRWTARVLNGGRSTAGKVERELPGTGVQPSAFLSAAVRLSRGAGLAFAFAVFACAQPTTTRIVDTLYNQDGSIFGGTLTISLTSSSVATGGLTVLRQIRNLTIKGNGANAGLLDTRLAPNDTAQPARTAYLFTFSTGASLTCTIPTSSSPITLANYCTPTPPPTSNVLLPPINIGGVTALATGTYCANIVNVGGVGTWGNPPWVTCAGGGGSHSMTWNGGTMTYNGGTMTWN